MRIKKERNSCFVFLPESTSYLERTGGIQMNNLHLYIKGDMTKAIYKEFWKIKPDTLDSQLGKQTLQTSLSLFLRYQLQMAISVETATFS